MTPSPNPLPPDNPTPFVLPMPEGLVQHARAVGVDVVAVNRVARGLERFGERYTQELFTEQERAYCIEQSGNRPTELANRLAARLAVKEAIAKALGCGLNGLGYSAGVPWNTIETIAKKDTPPQVVLHGKALAVQQQAGITQWLVSWAHDGGMAIAMVAGI